MKFWIACLGVVFASASGCNTSSAEDEVYRPDADSAELELDSRESKDAPDGYGTAGNQADAGLLDVAAERDTTASVDVPADLQDILDSIGDSGALIPDTPLEVDVNGADGTAPTDTEPADQNDSGQCSSCDSLSAPDSGDGSTVELDIVSDAELLDVDSGSFDATSDAGSDVVDTPDYCPMPIISEFIHGAGVAIEIYNPGSQPIDLAHLSLRERTLNLLAMLVFGPVGMLGPGETVTVCDDASPPEWLPKCDFLDSDFPGNSWDGSLELGGFTGNSCLVLSSSHTVSSSSSSG